MRGISLSTVIAFALMGASAPGCAVADEGVKDDQSALESTADAVATSATAFTLTARVRLIGIGMKSTDGGDWFCRFNEVCRFPFLAGSTLTIEPGDPDTINCRTWGSWTTNSACAGQGRKCILPNVNNDVFVAMLEMPLFGCNPK